MCKYTKFVSRLGEICKESVAITINFIPLNSLILVQHLVYFFFFSCFCLSSPDGKVLAFLSAKCSVDSGAHCATNSLHRVDWAVNGKLSTSKNIVDVVSNLVFTVISGYSQLH